MTLSASAQATSTSTSSGVDINHRLIDTIFLILEQRNFGLILCVLLIHKLRWILQIKIIVKQFISLS